jgi:hypothetical protein
MPSLDPASNEYYLFHGTKLDVVQVLKRHGFDERVGSVTGMVNRMVGDMVTKTVWGGHLFCREFIKVQSIYPMPKMWEGCYS